MKSNPSNTIELKCILENIFVFLKKYWLCSIPFIIVKNSLTNALSCYKTPICKNYNVEQPLMKYILTNKNQESSNTPTYSTTESKSNSISKAVSGVNSYNHADQNQIGKTDSRTEIVEQIQFSSGKSQTETVGGSVVNIDGTTITVNVSNSTQHEEVDTSKSTTKTYSTTDGTQDGTVKCNGSSDAKTTGSSTSESTTDSKVDSISIAKLTGDNIISNSIARTNGESTTNTYVKTKDIGFIINNENTNQAITEVNWTDMYEQSKTNTTSVKVSETFTAKVGSSCDFYMSYNAIIINSIYQCKKKNPSNNIDKYNYVLVRVAMQDHIFFFCSSLLDIQLILCSLRNYTRDNNNISKISAHFWTTSLRDIPI
ncbi:hypothetical protein BCR32DRAFT_280654 [Anaeromyces robustus]|uniref:Uncharacterized protein n=1 Tax=Anaeromyces robustus TaxID=1754192 RepID=A0A1Y1X3C8_9FUNG|nr:hypothetical protein BCR32DRAFT_280654 [Anaeromyces robustus]|eukprot:ORX80311.1 hypothetical protein BCR32DRAFT_280654 [Anaeromyces robustus]